MDIEPEVVMYTNLYPIEMILFCTTWSSKGKIMFELLFVLEQITVFSQSLRGVEDI